MSLRIHIPPCVQVLLAKKIQHTTYDQLVVKVLKRDRLPQDFGKMDEESNEAPKIATPAPAAVNQQSLKQVWDTSMVATQEEWRDWTKRLGLDLLRESPSVALRACQELAQEHNALNEALFNVAFISCWTTLYEPYQVQSAHVFGQRKDCGGRRRSGE